LLETVEVGGLHFLAPRDCPGVIFTTRLGGASVAPYRGLNLSFATGDDRRVVEENRSQVSTALGIPGNWIGVRQNHGARTLRVDDTKPLSAIVCREPGVVLSILTADCLPIALIGKDKIAAVHVGWRGLCSGVIDNVLSAGWEEEQAKVFIGPAIGLCHFSVGEEVVQAFRSRYPQSPEFWFKANGRLHFDLTGAAGWLFTRVGISVNEGMAPCTVCDPRFFSHRRDTITGRQGVLVWRS